MRWLWLVLLMACVPRPPQPEVRETRTPPMALQGLVRASEGPRATCEITLSSGYPERVFLTGVEIEVQETSGRSISASEVLSGASVRFSNAQRHADLNGLDRALSPLLFALNAQNTKFDCPAGTGIPVFSNELISVTAQWMNGRLYQPPLELQMTARLKFSRGQPLERVDVFVLGQDWGLTATPGDGTQEHLLEALPTLEVRAVSGLTQPPCHRLELVGNAGQVVDLNRDSWNLKGPHRLRASWSNPEPVNQSVGNLLILYGRELP